MWSEEWNDYTPKYLAVDVYTLAGKILFDKCRVKLKVFKEMLTI